MRSVLRARTRIFELDQLEIRRFLTTASISSNTLNVLGSGSGETITVNKNTSNRITVTGVSTTFDPNAFDFINISGVGGNDTITITGNVVYTSATITGGSGNDNITGGAGPDRIIGD